MIFKLKQTIMQQQTNIKLPSYTLLRSNCHTSTPNYLCYLTSTTQIRVININNPTTSYAIEIPLEPVRFIDMIQQDGKVFVAVAMVTRIMVFLDTQVFFESALKLDCNIVHFVGGYISVRSQRVQGNSAFVFATADGELVIYNIHNQSRILKSPDKRPIQTYCSMATNYPMVYFGDSLGSISCYRILEEEQKYRFEHKFNTESNLPILNILTIPPLNIVVFTTCYGQIFIFSDNLLSHSQVSIHHGAIRKVLYDGSKLYTFGEDSLMHIFRIKQNRWIELVQSEKFNQQVSVVFSCKKGTYIGFYEETKLVSA